MKHTTFRNIPWLLLLLLGTSCGDSSELYPKVATTPMYQITFNSAEGGGNVLEDGGYEVTSRGICWSTGINPVVRPDSSLSSGSGTGPFACMMTGLKPETTYYVRAYATNAKGTGYGESISFKTTKAYGIPVVTTNPVLSIDFSSADCGGQVTDQGGDRPVAVGICWSTSPNPTTDLSTRKVSGFQTGFNFTMTNLAYGTTYYVRAFAVNSKGTGYGEEKTFTTKALPGLEVISIPGGTFQMGSSERLANEAPVHAVTVGTFRIMRNEVTQALWNVVMGSNPSSFICNDGPVEKVSWNRVQDFISYLNAYSLKRWRLPTEAEWEFAAGGGSTARTLYAAGLNLTSGFDAYVWYELNAGSQTHPAGVLQPNGCGLYDMAGNVAELCNDWYKPYSPSAQTNPVGPASGILKVLRGGSFLSPAEACRTCFRDSIDPGTALPSVGFRLVRID